MPYLASIDERLEKKHEELFGHNVKYLAGEDPEEEEAVDKLLRAVMQGAYDNLVPRV